MENREDIFNEINGISPVVANIGKSNLYSVSAGYFDNLAGEILAKINGDILLQKNVAAPFQVPPGYFENLPGNILSKIKSAEANKPLENGVEAELEEIAPLLNTISKKNIYTVPDGYFESFEINKKIAEPAPAKVISIKNGTRKIVTYAAAATIAGIIATAGFLFINNKTVVKNNQNTIAGINIKDSLAGLSDDEIVAYLNDQPTAFDMVVPAQNDYDPDVEDLLNNASDAEIQQYLNDNKDPAPKKIKGI